MLDGLGGVYQSTAASATSINLSSASMPSTYNFEVLFSYVRKTSISPSNGGISYTVNLSVCHHVEAHLH